MHIKKNIDWRIIFKASGKITIYAFLWSSTIFIAHEVLHNKSVALPIAIDGILGTALAIFLGFRNNSSYDRWWEARKIWGGIVNYSRTWARQTLNHIDENKETSATKKELIYRHLAWINSVRLQLRNQQKWNQIEGFLQQDEFLSTIKKINPATHLVNKQGKEIRSLLKSNHLDQFRYNQMDNTLTELYNLQGMAERIKSTPLPRLYDYFTKFFLIVFFFILPSGMIGPLSANGVAYIVVPLSMVITTVFYTINIVGIYHEDPFENKNTDTPMSAICRVIEIDLRELLHEDEIPEKLSPQNGVLM